MQPPFCRSTVPGWRAVAYTSVLFAGVSALDPAVAQRVGPTPEPGNSPPATTPEAISTAPEGEEERYGFHFQATNVWQFQPGFTSPYTGPQSLQPDANARETVDLTFYGGLRLWPGSEIWINPEVDQGFGLSNTLGVAGFPSGEAYKVGFDWPYMRVQRYFFRQTIGLGGERQTVEPDLNVLGGSQDANRVVITIGKFSATDIFDTNQYAHDPRNDFLNWSLIDMGAWDYAADSWGYTYGGAIEWYQDWWTIRAGLLDLSRTSNSSQLDPRFISQSQFNLELEERHTLFGQPGKLKLLWYLSRGRLGKYSTAVAVAEATDTTPNVNQVRNYQSKDGFGFNLEQQLAPDLGLFSRISWTNPGVQAYDFTDIVSSYSIGVSLKGTRWGRENDTFGLAGVINVSSRQANAYFNAGGLGILVGDGQLPHPGNEGILETYYNFAVAKFFWITADYQFINNPAYNRDRGPVSVISARLHAQF